MLEIAISEFHLSRREFLFGWDLPAFMSLLMSRIERNRAAMTEKPKPPEAPVYSSIEALRMLG